MKSVTFFRNTWKRKGKDKITAKEKEDMFAVKSTIPDSAPCTPAKMTFDILVSKLSPSSLDHRLYSQSEGASAFRAPSTLLRKASSHLSSSTPSLVDEGVTTTPSAFSRLDVECPPLSPATWKSSHGPPKNAFHGPPSLKLYSPVSGTSPKSVGGSHPARPPRPPPLDLQSTGRRSVNRGTPPRCMANRAVTFVLPPSPRAVGSAELMMTPIDSSRCSPGRPGDQGKTSHRSSDEATRCRCVTISVNRSRGHLDRGALHDMPAAANLPPSLGRDISSPGTVHAVLDLSDTPVMQRVYQSDLYTSSTPHLPSQDREELPPLPFGSSNGQVHYVSDFPLSLFPPPPKSPLFIRRKIPKNLVLRPTPTFSNAPLPFSPVPASPEHTQLITPTTPHLYTNQPEIYSSPLPRCSSRGIPPRLFDPPSTPLPTLPTSPELPAARGVPSAPLSKSLRSVRSINQLRSDPLPPALPLTHRATCSEPPSMPGTKQTRRPVQSRPEAPHAVRPLTDLHGQSDSQTQWGYAF